MALNNNIRVLVDWDGDGIFNPSSFQNEAELPNLINDPVTMRAAQHYGVNGGSFYYENQLTQPTRIDAYVWNKSVGSISPRVTTYLDGNVPGRYVLRVRDFEGTTATNGIDIGRSAAELHGGRIPKPSDALKDIGAPAINNLAPGDYFLVFSARAVDDKSVGFQMNCQLTAASGAVSGNGGSINSLTNDWKHSIQVITVSSAVTELRIRFTINTAAVDDQYWEVANIGIYQALHPALPAPHFVGNVEKVGVWPTTQLKTDFGEYAVTISLSDDNNAGYRVLYHQGAFPALEPLQTYTLTCWARSNANTEFRMRTFVATEENRNVHIYGEEVIHTLSGALTNPNDDWVQFSLPIVTSPELDRQVIGFELAKNNSSSTGILQITGWMITRSAAAQSSINLLPEHPNAWHWEHKYSEEGIREVELSTPFGSWGLTPVVDANTSDTRQELRVLRDDANEQVFKNMLTPGTWYVLEYWEWLSFESDANFPGKTDIAPTILVGNDILNNSNFVARSWNNIIFISSEPIQETRGKWKRRQVMFTPREQTGGVTIEHFSLWIQEGQPVGSIMTIPKLYPLAGYPNLLPYPFTGLTLTNTGAATSSLATGTEGSFAQITVNIPAGETVTLADPGEIPVQADSRYIFVMNVGSGATPQVDILDQNSAVLQSFLSSEAEHGFFIGSVVRTFVTNNDTSSIRIRFHGSTGGEKNISNLWVIPWDSVPGGGVAQPPTKFNTGGRFYHIQGVDDITRYVLSATTKSGKNNFDEPLAYEGTLQLKLNNDTQVFSPANKNSPFFGLLKENLKIQIQLFVGGSWIPIWSGWTHTWGVEAGRAKNRQATLEARQGFFRLNAGEFRPKVFTDTTTSDVVVDLITHSGWASLVNKRQTFVSNALLGVDTFLRSDDQLFGEVDDGIYQLDFVGDEWNRRTNLMDVLKSVLRSEHAHLWMQRDGLLVLRNREYFINRKDDFDYEANLNTSVTAAKFRRGHDIVNRVEVQIKPKKENKGGIVWQSKAAFELPASRSKSPSIKRFEIDFRHEEGTPRTVTKVYGRGDGSTLQVFQTAKKNRLTVFKEVPDAQIDKYVNFRVVDSDDGSKVLEFENKTRKTIYVTATILGDYIEGGEVEVYVFENEAAIEEVQSVYKDTLSLAEFQQEFEAEEMAAYILLRKALPYAEFNQLTLIAQDEVDLERIKNWQIGTILLVTEGQTLEESLPHVIIEESFDLLPNQIKVTYTLAALDLNEYLEVGESSPMGRKVYL